MFFHITINPYHPEIIIFLIFILGTLVLEQLSRINVSFAHLLIQSKRGC